MFKICCKMITTLINLSSLTSNRLPHLITIEPGLELKQKISKMTPFLSLTVAVFYSQE